MKAPAIVFAEPKRIEIREMELPDVGPDQVGIRTAFSGISQGTERWALTGRYGHFDVDYSAYYPCSPGYQAAGVVEVVGGDVDEVSVGDHVMTMGTHFPDPAMKYPGPMQASHSGYLVARAAEVWRVDPAVDLAGASLFHMAGVSRHGVRLAGVARDDFVVVIGLGLIGQMAAQAARRVGAYVVATDLIRSRVEAAAQHSADRAVDPETESLEDVVRGERPGGADVVIDTTGVPAMFDRCRDLVRYEGKIVMQGYYPDPISIDFHPAHLKRPHVVLPCGWDDEFNGDLADDLRNGGLAIDPLITHRFSYRDAHEAYDLVVEHPERSLGMVFDWSDA